MKDWLGVTKIENDAMGRALKVQYPDGKEVAYSYGKSGERTGLVYPDGRKVTYSYDSELRLSGVDDGNGAITYGYDNAGRLARKIFPNGMETSYAYDMAGHLSELTHRDREGILDRYSYRYDLLGNKTAIEKQRRGLDEESGIYTYGYDAMGRLNAVARNGGTLRNYEYDAFGNRSLLREGGRETAYIYNAMNQLVSRADAVNEETYAYDKRGNLSLIMENGTLKNRYTYGILNRLEQAVNGKGEAATYSYNGLGCRVGKTTGRMKDQAICPETRIQYTIDLTKSYHNLLQKEEEGNTQIYLWDGNVTGMSEDGKGCEKFYLQDELGSPIRLIGYEGELEESYGYDEFGQDIYGNQGSMQPFGYTGYQADRITGTYYAQAREYKPELGRFTGQDIILGAVQMPITMNRYSYCFNNGLMLVDLDGAWPEWIETAAKVTTAVVAVVAVAVMMVVTAPVAVATVAAGAAVGGVVSGYANEKIGGSYINGYAGGFVGGGIQAVAGFGGPIGTILGGSANGLGALITDKLDNIDSWNSKFKSDEQILENAIQMAGKGMLYSIPGGMMQGMTQYANYDKAGVAADLMQYTPRMGRGLELFYGTIDNILIAGDADIGKA